MKKPLRGVVVEYKGGRHARKMNKSNALWGNIDLKAIAEDVQEDIGLPMDPATLNTNAPERTAAPVDGVAASEEHPAEPLAPVPAPRILEAISRPLTVAALSEMLPAKPIEASASRQKPKTVSRRRVKEIQTEQAPIVADTVTPRAEAIHIGGEIEVLEAENAALKRQLMEKLRSENAQLAKMLIRFGRRRQS